MTEKTIHEGRSVKRLREILCVKQETLANELGLSQQTVSLLEQKEALDKDMLEKIAKVLKIPVEAIKNFDEEAIVNNISCNFSDQAASLNYYPNFYPLDKYIEQVEEIKTLYKALIKEKDEKIALMERMLGKK